jgi:hypothetical protein
MLLCFVVSSRGRMNDRLEQLLASLAAQTDARFTVGVCDQSEDGSVGELARRWASRLSLFVCGSEAGLSAGRNAVVQRASEEVTHFAFPNDTTRFPADFVATIAGHSAIEDVIEVSYLEPGGPRYRLREGAEPLTRSNVWDLLEPAMILQRQVIADAGGFDEKLGSGAATPWQSGEGTDLLLRVLERRPLRVRWLPQVSVFGVRQSHALTPAEARRKLRAYGRGFGYVAAKHTLPWWFHLVHLVAPLVKSLLPPQPAGIADAMASTVGRAEGAVAGIRAARAVRRA